MADPINFSTADLGTTYVLDSGSTSPVVAPSQMGVGLSLYGRTDVFRGDTEPLTSIGVGMARSTASYTLCNGCTLTLQADFYSRTMADARLSNEQYLYIGPPRPATGTSTTWLRKGW